VDRQKLICFVNVGLAATAVGLALLGWLDLLNPYLILVSVFFIGVGFAFNAPTWTSIVPQVVSDAELPSAAILIRDHRSGVGWGVGSAGGSKSCICSRCCLFPPGRSGNPPMETTLCADKTSGGEFFQILRFRYPVCSLRARVTGRVGPKFPVWSVHFTDSGIDAALMPVVGLKMLHLSSSNLGLLFTSMGAGSVIGAVLIIPWLRARLSPDRLTQRRLPAWGGRCRLPNFG
jgi:MFS-type transporter involved in bile tolerance (Atg22 family)